MTRVPCVTQCCWTSCSATCAPSITKTSVWSYKLSAHPHCHCSGTQCTLRHRLPRLTLSVSDPILLDSIPICQSSCCEGSRPPLGCSVRSQYHLQLYLDPSQQRIIITIGHLKYPASLRMSSGSLRATSSKIRALCPDLGESISAVCTISVSALFRQC